MGPEMLTQTGFNELIHQDGFLESFRYFTIDECHLVIEWSFRESYTRIAHLRNRFPAGKIVWLALSATISRLNHPKFVMELGFSEDRRRCTTLRLPVDRQSLTYVTRFCKHSKSSCLDFSTLIPLSATKPSGLEPTVIFTQRIDFGNRLITYLTNLLPKTIEGVDRRTCILPYNSMMSQEHRLAAVKALRSGRARFLVCSDSGAFGIDISQLKRVVAIITDSDETFETLCQKHGRVRILGIVITYFPKWADETRMAKTDVKVRKRAPPVMIEYANSTAADCPRAVNCRHWGESLQMPSDVPCCNKHCPELDSVHYRELEVRAEQQKVVKPRMPSMRTDGLHRSVGKDLRPAVHQLLRQWRSTAWLSCESRTPLCPPNRLISDRLLTHLCKRLHVCTTMERFRAMLIMWDRLDEFGEPLFEFCQKLLVSTDKLFVAPKPRQKRKREAEVEVEEEAGEEKEGD
ncbi:hypothetical protein FRC12_010678 [Ceratobasidium sp. 428]|nr:hypothetical protein FRC12_010678 [Ceratobasidium sp. 428]